MLHYLHSLGHKELHNERDGSLVHAGQGGSLPIPRPEPEFLCPWDQPERPLPGNSLWKQPDLLDNPPGLRYTFATFAMVPLTDPWLPSPSFAEAPPRTGRRS